MRALLLKLEPIIWLFFGQGILIGTVLLTGWLLIVGVAAPLGWVSADALGYERAYGLASGLTGRSVLFTLIALPMWKGAHHLRALSIDFGGASRDAVVATLLYGLALVGNALALWAVIRL